MQYLYLETTIRVVDMVVKLGKCGERAMLLELELKKLQIQHKPHIIMIMNMRRMFDKIAEDLNHLARKSYGKTIIFPTDGIGTGLAMSNITAPKTFTYLTIALKQMFNIDNGDLIETAKIYNDLTRKPTKKFSSKQYTIGDVILFGHTHPKLEGKIIEVFHKNTPKEQYSVLLSENSLNQIHHKTNLKIEDIKKSIIVDKADVSDSVLQLRKKIISKPKIKKSVKKIIRNKIIKCKCKIKKR